MTTKTKPITRLSDMEYDEVSLVAISANQEADIVLFKSGAADTVTPRHDTMTHDINDSALVIAKARIAIAKSRK